MTGTRHAPATPVPADAHPSERELAALESTVLNHVFEYSPSYATGLGLHDWDGLVPDLSISAIGAWSRESDKLIARLGAIDRKGLTPRRRLDRDLLRLTLESLLFDVRDYPYHETLPLIYLGPVNLVSYMARPYAPAPVRAASMLQHLRAVPRLLDTGVRQLKGPLPSAFIDVGLAVAGGLKPHFAESEDFIRTSAPSEAPSFASARAEAEAAVDRFIAHLEASKARATPEFALGRERYARLLQVREGAALDIDELLRDGMADLKRNQARLKVVGAAMKPPVAPSGAAQALAPDHPDADHLFEEAAAFTEEVRRFMIDKDLVGLPTPERCRIEPTPTFERGFVTAALNPPGPFETEAYEGIYYVTPVEPTWDETKKREWIEYFNRPLFRIVTAHEVYPGHYLQFLHFRAHSPTVTSKVYLSSSFAEGWAHYTEQLMIEQGYRREDPKTEVAQLLDALLRNVRLVVSVSMHAKGMSLADAAKLFETEAHLEPFPAAREAMRGTFNPEYFCYTLGKLAILRARSAYQAAHPGRPIREFHDRLLSFGCPPAGWLTDLALGREVST